MFQLRVSLGTRSRERHFAIPRMKVRAALGACTRCHYSSSLGSSIRSAQTHPSAAGRSSRYRSRLDAIRAAQRSRSLRPMLVRREGPPSKLQWWQTQFHCGRFVHTSPFVSSPPPLITLWYARPSSRPRRSRARAGRSWRGVRRTPGRPRARVRIVHRHSSWWAREFMLRKSRWHRT
jgi:hypothetical protein